MKKCKFLKSGKVHTFKELIMVVISKNIKWRRFEWDGSKKKSERFERDEENSN